MLNLASIAYAFGTTPQAQSTDGGAPNPIMTLLPFILIIGVFYFILLRPQKKKQKEHAEVLSSLKKNDDVITAGGIHGTIVNVKDTTFIIRIDDNVRMEIQKSSISGKKKT
ncbi:MAG: preprotein translocase subunit YajC [Candidatus Omnitrophica bacterium]|nr:preprotein translocase subunit YajC [Candidatus Omnitrophota bacterium]